MMQNIRLTYSLFDRPVKGFLFLAFSVGYSRLAFEKVKHIQRHFFAPTEPPDSFTDSNDRH